MAPDLTQEVDLGGTIYVSSKRAAEISGYAQDYIGQLARSGQLDAKRISGLWYIQEESLKAHKVKAEQYVPVPPQRQGQNIDLEASISFDGRDYVSAQRGAKITGYSSDYVAQLARGDKIVSRQVGNRWYVDREALIKHKKYNDSLLAAVQAESVGLKRVDEVAEMSTDVSKKDNISELFTYITDSSDLIPDLSKVENQSDNEPAGTIQPEIYTNNEPEEAPVNPIPIRRVIQTHQTTVKEKHTPIRNVESGNNIKAPRIAMIFIVFLGIAVSGSLAYRYINFSETGKVAADGQSVAKSALLEGKVGNILVRMLSKDLFYKR